MASSRRRARDEDDEQKASRPKEIAPSAIDHLRTRVIQLIEKVSANTPAPLRSKEAEPLFTDRLRDLADDLMSLYYDFHAFVLSLEPFLSNADMPYRIEAQIRWSARPRVAERLSAVQADLRAIYEALGDLDGPGYFNQDTYYLVRSFETSLLENAQWLFNFAIEEENPRPPLPHDPYELQDASRSRVQPSWLSVLPAELIDVVKGMATNGATGTTNLSPLFTAEQLKLSAQLPVDPKAGGPWSFDESGALWSNPGIANAIVGSVAARTEHDRIVAKNRDINPLHSKISYIGRGLYVTTHREAVRNSYDPAQDGTFLSISVQSEHGTMWKTRVADKWNTTKVAPISYPQSSLHWVWYPAEEDKIRNFKEKNASIIFIDSLIITEDPRNGRPVFRHFRTSIMRPAMPLETLFEVQTASETTIGLFVENASSYGTFGRGSVQIWYALRIPEGRYTPDGESGVQFYDFEEHVLSKFTRESNTMLDSQSMNTASFLVDRVGNFLLVGDDFAGYIGSNNRADAVRSIISFYDFKTATTTPVFYMPKNNSDEKKLKISGLIRGPGGRLAITLADSEALLRGVGTTKVFELIPVDLPDNYSRVFSDPVPDHAPHFVTTPLLEKPGSAANPTEPEEI